MNLKLLNLSFENLLHYEEGNLNINFFAEKRVYDYEKEEKIVEPLFANISKLNSIALVGRNATGKTTTINLISDALMLFINNKSLSECSYIDKYFDNEMTIQATILVNKYLYKIHSIIKKDNSEKKYFADEKLYKKKVIQNMNKNSLLSFTASQLELDRSKTDNPFLKNDDSIFSGVLNNLKLNYSLIADMSNLTNVNLPIFTNKDISMSFVNYLDPSIETIKIIQNHSDNVFSNSTFELKFKNSSHLIHDDISQLGNYLSSGTIKGLNIFEYAVDILKTGGYLLVDEIENHLNKSIVTNIINLFTSRLNKYGATLIFTTHYSEILDSFERSDNIYILDKKEKISIDKFSILANNKDRIDKKKSDMILSGKVGSTPSYMSYRNMVRTLKEEVNI